ncbi:MAG: ribosome-associated translation inhibitor RaiA [Clostridiales bacterium]|nr:ribosome-associated translation inhibitor RaiA [Clostridiales bacterium]
MKITTQGKGIKIGQRLENKIVSKMSKFDKYFGEEGSFNVRIRPEGSQMVVEITLKLDNKIYRAESRDEEILTAVDKTVDKLESQIRKQKTKLMKKRKDYPEIANYLDEDNSADFDYEVENDSKITRKKTFTLRPMTSEDALLQMEMLGHNFFVYLDSETNSVCVIYKRNDGNYGLLEPDY